MFQIYTIKHGCRDDVDIFPTRAEAEREVQKLYVEDMACGEYEDYKYAIEDTNCPGDWHDERVGCTSDFDEEDDDDEDEN